MSQDHFHPQDSGSVPGDDITGRPPDAPDDDDPGLDAGLDALLRAACSQATACPADLVTRVERTWLRAERRRRLGWGLAICASLAACLTGGMLFSHVWMRPALNAAPGGIAHHAPAPRTPANDRQDNPPSVPNVQGANAKPPAADLPPANPQEPPNSAAEQAIASTPTEPQEQAAERSRQPKVDLRLASGQVEVPLAEDDPDFTFFWIYHDSQAKGGE